MGRMSRTDRELPWRRAALTFALVTAGVGAVGAGCTFETPIPKDPPAPDETRADTQTPIAFGQTYEAQLDCQQGRCNARFRLDVEEPGTLHVTVSPRLSDESGVRVSLQDTVKRVIAQQRAADDESLSLRAHAEPGRYFVLVQTLGGPVRFELRAEMGE